MGYKNDSFLIICVVLFVIMCISMAGAMVVAGPKKPAVYNENSNGGPIAITAGGAFSIILPENPTTGYSWNITASGIQLISDEYVPDDKSGKLMGAGGKHEWKFKAAEPGQYEINGIYKRPWMNTDGSEKTYKLTVIVK